ncbi:Rieske 2Fe-2S domain-containing protein [Actibacterium sp. D379-3]
MLTKDENELLCRVEGDAPMGQYMRRYWVPAVLLEQVETPGGKPVRVRLFGEDLVAFRNTEGRVGVIGEFCAHRKASLVYGRNEDCGLRCLYHGWLFDPDGNVTDMPSEPEGSGFADKVKHKAYPVREAGGFVWVYMGPEGEMPEFEAPAWAPSDKAKVSIVKIELPCNWAQVLEGQIDSAHSSSLHSSDMKPARTDGAKSTEAGWTRPSTDKCPRIQVQLTNYGMRYAAIRKPLLNPQTHDYVRITTYIAPFTALIPPNNAYYITSVIVPRDDTSTYFHFIAWSEEEGIDQDAWRQFNRATVGVDLDEHYRSVARTPDNDYGQDRDLMAAGNFTGITGIPHQDIAMWESMGVIADRTSERLGASDIAVVQFRRLMLSALQKFQQGAVPLGLVEPHIPTADIRSYQGLAPKIDDWRYLGVMEKEKLLLDNLELDDVEKEMAEAAGS